MEVLGKHLSEHTVREPFHGGHVETGGRQTALFNYIGHWENTATQFQTMRFLFIESFFQGSHRLFAEGLRACSSHEIDILSMPGENWRWRMLGSALHVIEAIPPLEAYDGIITSDLFNLSDFKALVDQPCPPVMVYFHENQITYPQPP